MFISLEVYIVLGIGTALAAIWLYLLLSSKKYDGLVTPLSKEFYVKEIYPVGLKILELVKYQYKLKHDRSLRQYISIYYGEKYTEYYLRIIHAQRISLAYITLLVFFPLYVFAMDLNMMLLGLGFTGLAYYYFGEEVKNKVKKLEKKKMRDFPDIISKLALLTNAGMIMREAWEKVAYTGESEIYHEMRKVVDEINNGVSDVDAYFNFGMRCSVPEIKKFASILIQGLVKGNQEIVSVLQKQNKEIWEGRKHNVRQQGEKASSKLLIPITIMFIGILIMIIVPIFSNLGV